MNQLEGDEKNMSSFSDKKNKLIARIALAGITVPLTLTGCKGTSKKQYNPNLVIPIEYMTQAELEKIGFASETDSQEYQDIELKLQESNLSLEQRKELQVRIDKLFTKLIQNKVADAEFYFNKAKYNQSQNITRRSPELVGIETYKDGKRIDIVCYSNPVQDATSNSTIIHADRTFSTAGFPNYIGPRISEDLAKTLTKWLIISTKEDPTSEELQEVMNQFSLLAPYKFEMNDYKLGKGEKRYVTYYESPSYNEDKERY